MITKRTIVVAVVLLLANTSFAQFSQSSRLSDLTSRLSSDASNFADASYRGSTGSYRNTRTTIEAAMLAHQFSGAAQLFNRMVNDRRPNQELRDGFQLLQDFSRSLDRNNLRGSGWSSIQRDLSDISRELNYGDSGSNEDQYPPSRSGRMTWKGRVDDDVRITIRGGSADVETIGGSPYYDAATNFTASLPPSQISVRLVSKRGRGEVFIEQQPSRENDHAAVVRIRDTKGGASDYEFTLEW
ncbi:MAG: hypothetical protein ABJB97_00390 [Acidobacteriota bacterium]